MPFRTLFMAGALLGLLVSQTAFAAEPQTAEEVPPATASREEPGKAVWVAVGYGGRRLLSTDRGRTWEITAEWAQPGGDDKNNLMSLVYAPSETSIQKQSGRGGRFVAVGGGGGGSPDGGHLLLSDTGRDWREVFTLGNRIHPVLFGGRGESAAAKAGRFVVGGPQRRLWWSDDAESWHEGPQLENRVCTHFRQGAVGNGRFVLIGNHGGNSVPYWSASTRDGETIEGITADLPALRGLAFGNGRFVAVGPDGTRRHSTDGIRWESADDPAAGDFTWIVWTGSEFVAGGAGKAARSPDGLTWTPWPTRIPCNVLSVAEGTWIGTSWPGQMWFSDEGQTWQKSPALTANGINRAVVGIPTPSRETGQ